MIGRNLKSCLFSFSLFITLMIGGCGSVPSAIQPQASIPLPEEGDTETEDTGDVVISEPSANGIVSIMGLEQSLPEEVDIIIQVSSEDEEDADDDDSDDEISDDGENESDPEDAVAESCSLDLLYCPQMSVDNRCREKTKSDGSFTATVPAKISNSIAISYIDALSCGEVQTYEATVISGGTTMEMKPLYSYPTPETETIISDTQPTYQPLPEGQLEPVLPQDVPQDVPQQDMPQQGVPQQGVPQIDGTNFTNTTTATNPITAPLAPQPLLPLSPLPSDPTVLPIGGDPILNPVLPPPPPMNQLPVNQPSEYMEPPTQPFVNLFPILNDKYNRPLVSWIDPQGSFVAARLQNGTMTLSKRVTHQGNPVYNARLVFSEPHASFTPDEVLTTCWCLPFVKAAEVYTRLFWVREPAPGENVAASLFIADTYEAASPFANLPVRRLPLLDVANALGLGDVRAIRKIPFVGMTDDALLLVFGTRKPLGPMEYSLVIMDRFSGMCSGMIPLSTYGLFAGPDQINVNLAQRLENDGTIDDYLMFFDPVTLQRWAFNLETLGLVPLPVMLPPN